MTKKCEGQVKESLGYKKEIKKSDKLSSRKIVIVLLLAG